MSSNLVIKVEGLSKQYRLGQIGTGTISHDLNRWMAKLAGKEDPYAKIGAVNSRSVKSDDVYAWALKDINFEVDHGDVLGIIGSNGAGKSTLLKLLSRVTAPTTGSIKVKGRIASLLEVGTGFHPEMTGKENIFMNGAILGMTKSEIKRKFDEIVDFAGVARYIDTPVKRYSSGMYVRLAFAVAAYLESEILILDEVLAVGDAEFQKKCLGKMGDVAKKDGRTVLFVSHNIFAVSAICNKGLLLVNGTVAYNGNINSTIDTYFKSYSKAGEIILTLNKHIAFNGLSNRRELDNLNPNDDVNIKFSFDIGDLDVKEAMIDINIFNENKVCVGHSRSLWKGYTFDIVANKTLHFDYFLKSPKMAPGEYTISIYICKGTDLLVYIDNIDTMTINGLNFFGGSMYLDHLKSTSVPEFNIEASSN